jgi:hypothetical protein
VRIFGATPSPPLGEPAKVLSSLGLPSSPGIPELFSFERNVHNPHTDIPVFGNGAHLLPIVVGSRYFLSAALAHLGLALAYLLQGVLSGTPGSHWDAFLWVFLLGFVGFTTAGFSLHLLPVLSRRESPGPRAGTGPWVLMELGILGGFLALALGPVHTLRFPGGEFAAASYTVGVALLTSRFLGTLRSPTVGGTPSPERTGDRVTVPLFAGSWLAAMASGGMFTLSAWQTGPGLGWWIAAIHMFVLGHVLCLLLAVGLRLVPRALRTDPPRGLPEVLAALAIVGALGVPTGMLLSSPSDTRILFLLAIPEALWGLLYVPLLTWMYARNWRHRSDVVLLVVGGFLLWAGGGLGLGMAFEGNFSAAVSHALLNALGFVGGSIYLMWFWMIAPFQRVSHSWSRRIRWGGGSLWLAAVILAALAFGADLGGPTTLEVMALGLGLFLSLLWLAGTLPVLFPALNPLPGLTTLEIRRIREKWHSLFRKDRGPG